MDEKNNTINNGETQGNMNYSFDFANQVDNTVPSTPVANQTSESAVETLDANVAPAQVTTPAVETLDVNSTVTPTVTQPSTPVIDTPVVNSNVTPEVAPNVTSSMGTSNVATSGPQVVETPTITPTVTVAPAQVATPAAEVSNATPDVNQAIPSEATNTNVGADSTSVSMPEVTPVVPITPETIASQNKDEENIELIKDKKATKNFLIVLFILLIAFIIALPFIFNIMG